MKQFRKILFWLHLGAGVFAGIVVLIMSVTGVALMYEKQMTAWADLRNFRLQPAAAGAARIPVETLLEKVRAERGELPDGITVRADPADPVAFSYGREATVYVNPYSGEILGEGSAGMRSFFRTMTDWHRWLGAGGENRQLGRSITGACNLAFLFIVASGMYLWWPRSLRWQNVKAVIFFRGGLNPKARDFNWHNVIGFWSALPLFFVVLSGTVISYPWASDLVYRVAGEEPPARRGTGGPRGPGAGPGAPRAEGKREGGPRRKREGEPNGERRAEGAGPRGDVARNEGQRGGPTPGEERQPEANGEEPNLAGLQVSFGRAGEQAPGWKTISLRLPRSSEDPLNFAIDQGSGGQPQLRSTLTLDRRTAEVKNWETFDKGTPGRKLRTVLRFLHTGEVLGVTGQTIAGLVSAGAVFLVYTGFALTLRRFAAWVRRKRARDREGVLVGAD